VIFAIDRAGPVPADGETHQGLFDIALLRPVPNMTILCPASEKELELMLSWALMQDNPIAIRYPKADCPKEIPEFSQSIEKGRGVLIKNSDKSRILITCTGGMYNEVKEASAILAHRGLSTDIYNVRFAKPIDENYFLNITKDYSYILFVEDGMKIGSLSSYLESLILRYESNKTGSQSNKTGLQNKKTAVLAFEDMFFPHGTRSEIFKGAGVSAEHIVQAAELLFTETHTVSASTAIPVKEN